MEKLVSCLSLLTLIAVGALVEVNVAVAEDETAAPQFMLRVEIFDLPADEALRIQQEVAIQPDQLETLGLISSASTIRTATSSGCRRSASPTSWPPPPNS